MIHFVFVALVLAATCGQTVLAHTFEDRSSLIGAITSWESNQPSALATYGPPNSWNTSQVISMYALFWSHGKYPWDYGYPGDGTFNEPIGLWDTSRVLNMQQMFYRQVLFDANISRWDVASVTNFDGMFSNAFAFNQDISVWDTSEAVDMDCMFEHAQSFDQDISMWNISKVQTFCWSTDGGTLTGGCCIFDGAIALSNCNKRRIWDAWRNNPVWPSWGRYASWGNMTCDLPPSTPASPPKSGAVIELTGDMPRIIFGTVESPVCELSLNRANGRLDSTCSLQAGRRLNEYDSSDETFDSTPQTASDATQTSVEAELLKVKVELAEVKMELMELKMLVSKLV